MLPKIVFVNYISNDYMYYNIDFRIDKHHYNPLRIVHTIIK